MTRKYLCEACRGVVRIPAGVRRLTLTQVRSVHDKSCPAKARAKSTKK